MRRASSVVSRYPRRVTAPYVGGANTISSLGLVAGDPLLIPSGQTWTLDCKTPSLGSVTVSGTLVADQTKDVAITASNIDVSATGTLQIGSVVAPYTKKAVITLTGAEAGKGDRFVADLTGSSGAGNGKLARLFASTGAVAETITVTFSSATAFTVSGSVSGALGAGTVGTLFNNKVRFIATAGGTPWAAGHTRTIGVVQLAFFNSGTPRSLQVQIGGKLILIGNPPAIKRTTVNAHVSAAAASLTIAETTGWSRDDEIVIGPTDFYGTAGGTSEKLFVKGKATTPTLPLKGTVVNPKWGVMQYATDTGMSLTPGVLTNDKGVAAPDWAAIPKTLDQRAPVINLTRNIVIQGIDDQAWKDNRFGAHTMYMGLVSEIKLDGVEFRRVGQAGAIGRYPIHWHMLSYATPDGITLPSDGTFLGAASGHYIKNCSVHQSSQRAIVIHGTHGIAVDSNVCYDITAHAIFLEDGAEKSNTITNNVVMKVRSPTASNRLLVELDGGTFQSTGYWYSNPSNTFSGNWASDCQGVGIWNAYAPQCWGLCNEVNENPQNTDLLLHDGNTTHSNLGQGMMTENRQASNAGAFSLGNFRGNVSSGFEITNQKLWKNTGNGYENRIIFGAYRGWTQADNEGQDFHGASSLNDPRSEGNRLLVIGESLNNATSRATATHRNAFASYHEFMNFKDSVAINYPFITPVPGISSFGVGGGVIRLNDIYTEPIYRFNLFSKLKLIGCNAGSRILPPTKDGNPLNGREFTLAGAILDVNGLWTTPGYYWIYDDPFLTYNATGLIDVAPAGQNGKATPDKYYGLKYSDFGFVVNGQMWDTVTMERLDSGTTVVGDWSVPGETQEVGSLFGIMRHASLAKGGRYRLKFPDDVNNQGSILKVLNAADATDNFLIGMQWSNATPVGSALITVSTNVGGWNFNSASLISEGGTITRQLTSAANLAAVEAGGGNLYWQDTTNNLVWVKYVGGLTNPVWAGSYEENQFHKPTYICIKA